MQVLNSNIACWSILGGATVFSTFTSAFAKKHVFTVSSSYSGALLASLGTGMLLRGSPVNTIVMFTTPSDVKCSDWQCYALAIAWVVGGTFGLVIQALTTHQSNARATHFAEEIAKLTGQAHITEVKAAQQQQQQQQPHGGPPSAQSSSVSLPLRSPRPAHADDHYV